VEGGINTGGGTYVHDSTAIIVATPNVGWDFINWTENSEIVTTDSLFSYNVLENKNFIAHYSKKIYSISSAASPIEGGVTLADSANYTHGKTVSLSAIANSDSGWEFINWTENGFAVSADSIYTFVADRNRILSANFQLKTYSVELSVNPTNAGNFTGSGNYIHGDNVTIIATPGDGWNFANWSENDINISSDPNYTFRITGNRNITANFANELYFINGSPQPVQAGIVSGTGSFYFGQPATIIATPNIGWNFNNWTENGSEVSNNPSYQFSVSGNRNLIANFNEANFTISCSINPIEAGQASGNGIYHYGEEAIVSFVKNGSWEFINWTDNGDTVSNLPEYIFNVDSDRDLVANFDFVSDVEKLDNYDIVPDSYYLSNAYPNPFNPSTKINFGIPESSTVKIFIANVNGQIVRTVLSGAKLPAGNYSSTFNADNLSSGIYFYIFMAQSEISNLKFKNSGKLILLK